MRRIKGEKVEVIYTDRVENEAEEVAREVKRQKEKGKIISGRILRYWCGPIAMREPFARRSDG